MGSNGQTSDGYTILRGRSAAVLVALAIIAATQPVQAQTFKLLYTFTNGTDGNTPYAGLTLDATGNLYGTAYAGGGANDDGTVFELAPSNGGWTFKLLHSFDVSGRCGAYPLAGVALDPSGDLYTAPTSFGKYVGGAVDKIDSSGHCTALHEFGKTANSALNPQATPILDAAGNLYGNTDNAQGSGRLGNVWEISANGDYHVLHRFQYKKITRPGAPEGNMLRDTAGNLYGSAGGGDTTGCKSCGTVYKLSPGGNEGWKLTLLHTFNNSDGYGPLGGVTAMDSAGSIYGTTYGGGSSTNCSGGLDGPGCGVVYKITQDKKLSVLYNFQGPAQGDGCCSEAGVILDSTGNIYGVTAGGGTYNSGTVFKLTLNGKKWTETILYSFTGGDDGLYPIGPLVMDTSGNLYGTTCCGGANGAGTIFEITP